MMNAKFDLNLLIISEMKSSVGHVFSITRPLELGKQKMYILPNTEDLIPGTFQTLLLYSVQNIFDVASHVEQATVRKKNPCMLHKTLLMKLLVIMVYRLHNLIQSFKKSIEHLCLYIVFMLMMTRPRRCLRQSIREHAALSR
jgi:hypothetical protein